MAVRSPYWFVRQACHDPTLVRLPPDRTMREDATMVVQMTGSNKGSFDTRSDDSALNFEQRCPVCYEPMQVACLESGVPGLPPGMRRQMIKCSACKLVTFHTFALEPGP